MPKGRGGNRRSSEGFRPHDQSRAHTPVPLSPVHRQIVGKRFVEAYQSLLREQPALGHERAIQFIASRVLGEAVHGGKERARQVIATNPPNRELLKTLFELAYREKL